MNKQRDFFEIIVGTFVILCAAIFFLNSFKSAKVNSISGYELLAKFDNASGIDVGSDVKISGIKIGHVESQELDKETYSAKLKLKIEKDVKLPSDSSIKISSEGLLGSKFLAIEIGADEEMLKQGDEIKFTQSSVNFEDLLGKFIFNSEKKNDKK